jgi:phosphate starvation-inducible membrane PsiE
MKIPILDFIFFPNLDDDDLFRRADDLAYKWCLFFSILELCALVLVYFKREISQQTSYIIFVAGGLSVVIIRKIFIIRNINNAKNVG